MGLKELFKKRNDPTSVKYRREMAAKVCGHHIRYVTENRDGVDEVIGKNGGFLYNARLIDITVF